MVIMPEKPKEPSWSELDAPSELRVTKLHTSHTKEASDLDEICMGFQHGWSTSTWNTVNGYVAFQEKVLAGAIQYTVVPMGKQRGVILIGKVIVLPDCRRQGVGTALVNRVKERSLVGRIKYVTVNVHEDELDVCCFFRANGFEIVTPPRELLDKKYYLMRWKVRKEDAPEY